MQCTEYCTMCSEGHARIVPGLQVRSDDAPFNVYLTRYTLAYTYQALDYH
jgi:hypothetical protein